MAFHATVRTAREKSGLKAGLRRREKSGLEREFVPIVKLNILHSATCCRCFSKYNYFLYFV